MTEKRFKQIVEFDESGCPLKDIDCDEAELLQALQDFVAKADSVSIYLFDR